MRFIFPAAFGALIIFYGDDVFANKLIADFGISQKQALDVSHLIGSVWIAFALIINELIHISKQTGGSD